MMDSNDIVVGLDIGTVNITAVIGEYDTDRSGEPVLKIVGVGNVPSEGIRNGVIINKESASGCIVQAVEDAVNMSGRDVEEVVCGISGHVKGMNSIGVVKVDSRRRGEKPEITEQNKQEAMRSAGAIPEVPDRETFFVMPIEYKVNNQGGIKNPLHMIGNRLEVQAHIITASTSAMRNLKNCLDRSDYGIQNMVPITLADCKAVLIPEEEKTGVMVIDIGGGTTEVGIQMNGATYFTGVVPIGGRYVTNDIAAVLKLSGDIAEKIKVNRGVCHESLVDDNETIEIPVTSGSFGEKSISRLKVCEIAKARMWEIFSKVKRAVEDAKVLQHVNSGIVLTGGGALLPGVDQVAEEVFKIPVRIGVPTGFTVDIDKDGKKIDGEIFNNPRYAGAIGLAQIGLDMKIRSQMEKNRKKPDKGMGPHDDIPEEVGDGFFKKVGKWAWDKTKSFVKDF
ncbi:MAG: cell division protein FtsA [Spirochaetia bacterium]|nr:cell division protein FtsA [Spirochaetia bacterium]MBR4796740.1 cell division protein FtsA [Spirochaetia bacterium]MBR5016994.1 cell division protein FtsA [Spirochaetia bacterium]MBR5927760.1 cell division protein FtsA [Spirochaetia bacterium]